MKKNFFGQPKEIIFCKKCVESNQRFVSSVQHKILKNQVKDTALFDNQGVCYSCKFFEEKKKINWDDREKEFSEILEKFRKNDGSYDVLVPGSGGKDSIFTSYILKEKYKMHPLTCTWAPGMYTDIGWINFKKWISNGFDNILFTPNRKIHSLLTRLAFVNLCHPFQPFALGQNSFATRVALEKNIKLIVYGDGLSERAIGKINLNDKKKNTKISRWHYKKRDDEIFLGGVSLEELQKKYGLSKHDLNPYLPISEDNIFDNSIELLHITDFYNYHPQKNYYFAKEKKTFEVNPDGRSEGTYTKYQSLDDKIDGLHFYTWFIKTGRGRATDDAALEVRNKIITRDEAKSLVKRFDGEFPKKYFNDCLNYMNISEEVFYETIDSFRPDHIWSKKGKKWELKKAVWHEK